MKILTVLGARPQFIKAAAVSREIAKRSNIREVLVHTGQHFDREMSDIFFDEMDIPRPQYHLGVNSLGHAAMTGRMLEALEPVLMSERPDYVLVYGDTNSTLAGALAAKKLRIKVAHVEAGLRSFNLAMPEEINRILTDRISDVLCCPTSAAVRNLRREGFAHFPGRVIKTGDVMFDAARHYGKISAARSDIMGRLRLRAGEFLLGTVHRAENTDDRERLSGIVEALNVLSRETAVVVPLHPRTAAALKAARIKTAFKPLQPVGYFDMVELLKNTRLVLTDSGGLQKEAYFFGKPCVTLRDETEWTELVECGCNVLAGARPARILAACRRMAAKSIRRSGALYGKGDSAAKVLAALS